MSESSDQREDVSGAWGDPLLVLLAHCLSTRSLWEGFPELYYFLTWSRLSLSSILLLWWLGGNSRRLVGMRLPPFFFPDREVFA